MDLASALTSFATIFVVIDPVGMAPIFVAMTSDMAPAHRRAVAIRACVIAAGILMVFGLFGNALLSTLGISLAAFRIAGGLLLFLIAVDMLFEKRTERREGREADADNHDPSVFPLATPLIAGPGSMAAMILLNSGNEVTWLDRLEVQLVMLTVVGLVLILFFLSAVIARLLGRTGILVVTRLLGMLLAALSVQFVLNGLIDLGVLTG
ncbi:MarC family protein [Pseudoruegeria sp. SK021]|uniref:MarC family protein n=1 Tax=Pseudoruegeria sp. SK021 TaxID=1933035 RepID=UPI000A25A873|nr:MarC family protein [Pseudoruegeria sp. SK021]OSP55415.1 MarC family transcriptional regulator [Pseudoruegeria sp. SK021]